MRTRRNLLMGATATALLGTAGLPRRRALAATAPIRVGCSITQTGPYSPPAVFELQGYQLAADDLNKAGGVLGRKLEIVAYDDQGNPSTALQLYQKLIHSDRVDLLVSPYQADLVLAVAPLVSRARMVMPSLGANVEPYQGKYPYLIQAITQTPRYMVPAIDLAASRGYRTVALLVQNTQFPQELAKGIADEAAAKGMSVVFRETYAPSTSDFSALVIKAAQGKPDVIIGATYLADAMGIVRAAKAQNIQAKMFAFSIGPVEPEFGKGLGSAAEGMFGTTLYFPSLRTKGNAEFVAGFSARFGRPPDYHAAVAYASLKVMAQAVQQVGSLDQEKIRDAMLRMSVDTVVGRFQLSPTGLQTGYTSYVLQWLNGKQELVWPGDEATAQVLLPHPAW
ncbi:MAG TPA: amino acid ABC transporter substrate-binding protein [Acetobacteraceae bacterium]|nr:amino acid ABC transporter substrate-binding protein [Acetobacteraceae bacterium]